MKNCNNECNGDGSVKGIYLIPNRTVNRLKRKKDPEAFNKFLKDKRSKFTAVNLLAPKEEEK